MWSRVRIGVVMWAITAVLLLVATVFPPGLLHDLWLVLPMFSGMGALVMSCLGFAEVASELIGRRSGAEPTAPAGRIDRPAPPRRAARRRAA